MNYIFKFNRFQKLIKEELEFLHKEPKYKNLFQAIKDNDELSDDHLKLLYDRIKKHRNTLKQNKIDLTQLKTSEEVEDKLTQAELIEKSNKFIKLLPSHLRRPFKEDENLVEQFKNIIIDYNYEDFKNNFIKKISKYRTPEEFLSNLSEHVNSLNQGINSLVNDLKRDRGAKLIYNNNQVVIAMIFTKKTSCKHGSRQWCISGDTGGYWNHYVTDRSGVQYFIWDFTKESTDIKSQLGVTIYENGYDAHYKNDNDAKSYVKEQFWFEFLKDFNNLSYESKAKYIKHNPKMIETITDDELLKTYLEKEPSLISSLSNKQIESIGLEYFKDFYNKFPDIMKQHHPQAFKFYDSGYYDRFEESELWVFIAKEGKKKVGTSLSGKNLYEDSLEIETLVKYNPFKRHEVKMLQMRSHAQMDSYLYGVWMPIGVFGDKDYVYESEIEDWLIDVIDQFKNRI